MERAMKPARHPATYTTAELRCAQRWARKAVTDDRLQEHEQAAVAEWLEMLDAEDKSRQSCAQGVKIAALLGGFL